jgi:HAD superfamily hydrolase (TIGR01509 family)
LTSSFDNTSTINAIIFDLGGVLLNVDYNRTEQAFIDLGLKNFQQIYTQSKQSGLFDSFEIGDISALDFITELQNKFVKKPSTQQITDAWNAMLLDFPPNRLELLEVLNEKVEVYLFSNTNELHYKAFNELFAKSFNKDFSEYFNCDYYSHLLGMRKPNASAFNYILETHGLLPEHTLFIDDSLQHVEGAGLIGINTIHLKKGQEISEVLRAAKILT